MHNYALELGRIDSNQPAERTEFSSSSICLVICIDGASSNETGGNYVILLLDNTSHSNLELIPLKNINKSEKIHFTVT